MTDRESTAARWAEKPLLTGDLVTLRPFSVDDAPVMARILADPEVLRLTASVTSSTAIAAVSDQPDEKLLSWYGTRAAQVDRLDLAVIDRASGELVGEVVLNEWNAEANSCSFRTLFGPAGRGRGLGTEAARLILDHGFQVLGLHRISLNVFAFNPRAKRVYDKVGFLTEGVQRDAFRFDGGYVDKIMMAILAPEWELHRGRPELT